MISKMGFSRRKFLKTSALGMIGSGVLGQLNGLNAQDQEASETPKIKEYRILGRTGFKASDISAGVTTDVTLLNALLDSGINYIDTSESYAGGRIEETVGEAIKNRDRKSLFITTKTSDHSSSRKLSKENVTKEGMRKYAALPNAKADKCLSCDGPCQSACPYGVLVQGLLIHAHQLMTLA